MLTLAACRRDKAEDLTWAEPWEGQGVLLAGSHRMGQHSAGCFMVLFPASLVPVCMNSGRTDRPQAFGEYSTVNSSFFGWVFFLFFAH